MLFGSSIPPFDPLGTFARRQSIKLRKDNPEKSNDKIEKEVRELWQLWVEHQTRNANTPQVKSKSQVKQYVIEDLGFATTRRHTPFPAIRLWEAKAKDRLRVRFLVTGEEATIIPANWTPFSKSEALRLSRQKEVNRAGFSQALVELRRLVGNLSGCQEPRKDLPDSMTIHRPPRSFGKFSVSLLDENELNVAVFNEKMYQGEDGKYRCKSCPTFVMRSYIKSKRHSRSCGARPKAVRKKSMIQKLCCSVKDCGENFSRKKQLDQHYSQAHSERLKAYTCLDCNKEFSYWQTFKRHRREKHLDSSRHQCLLCPGSFIRRSTLVEHMKTKHSDTVLPVEENAEIQDYGADNPEREFDHEVDVREVEEVGEVEDDTLEYSKIEDGGGDSEADEEQLQEERGEGVKEMSNMVRRNIRKMLDQDSLCDYEKETRLKSLREQLLALGIHGNTNIALLKAQQAMKRKARAQESRKRNVVEVSSDEASTGPEVHSILDEEGGIDMTEEPNGEGNGKINEEVQSTGKFTCPECGKMYRDRFNLDRHNADLHMATLLPNSCTRLTCTRYFATIWELKVHRNICKNSCRHCTYETVRNDKWLAHVSKHPQ